MFDTCELALGFDTLAFVTCDRSKSCFDVSVRWQGMMSIFQNILTAFAMFAQEAVWSIAQVQ
jgi:hypothetical protein